MKIRFELSSILASFLKAILDSNCKKENTVQPHKLFSPLHFEQLLSRLVGVSTKFEFFWKEIIIIFIFLNYFDTLMLKINFWMKNILKNNIYYTFKPLLD
jgi:hypothetical protein